MVIIAQAMDLKKENRGGFSFGAQLHFTFRGDMVHLFSKKDDPNLL